MTETVQFERLPAVDDRGVHVPVGSVWASAGNLYQVVEIRRSETGVYVDVIRVRPHVEGDGSCTYQPADVWEAGLGRRWTWSVTSLTQTTARRVR